MCSSFHRYELSEFTVPTAINYLDRYLSKRVASQYSLMPTALTCLFIASKVHDVNYLVLEDLTSVSMPGGSCSSLFFTSMEGSLLKTLDWNLNPVVAHRFVNYFLLIGPLSDTVKTQVKVIIPDLYIYIYTLDRCICIYICFRLIYIYV